jgi:hypothetical protein
MLAAVGYWGFRTQSGRPMKTLFGIGLPVLIAVLWGMFIAPKAIYPLSGISRLLLELILLGSGAVALFASGKTNLGWIYIAILLINELLLVLQTLPWNKTRFGDKSVRAHTLIPKSGYLSRRFPKSPPVVCVETVRRKL